MAMSKGSQIDFLIEIKHPPFYGEMQQFISLACIKFKCEQTSDELIQRFWKNFREDLEELVKEDVTELTPRGIETLRQFLTETNAYRKYLKDLPEAEFVELYKGERLAWQSQREAVAEKFDKHRFFNEPDAAADFEYWAACAGWTADEAVALSFGKDPSVVNSKTIPQNNRKVRSPFARTFERRKRLVSRAIAVGDLMELMSPFSFLEWATNIGIQCPFELLAAAEEFQDWKRIAEKLREKVKSLERELEGLNKELAQYKDQPLHPRARQSLMAMTLAHLIQRGGNFGLADVV